MTPMQMILSQELFLIADNLKPNLAARARVLACAKLARLLEQELTVHRLGEAGTVAKRLMEAEANKALVSGTIDDGGKVVRPDFGKKGGRRK